MKRGVGQNPRPTAEQVTFTSVLSRQTFVSACCVWVMCRFFVLPQIVMLGGLSVMFRGVDQTSRNLQRDGSPLGRVAL